MRPSVLYHYTDAAGFAGILDRGELWATDVRFLNDAQELKYSWEAFRSTLAERAAQETEYSEAYAAALDAIGRTKAEDLDLMEFRVFAASLSELRDDVPQWRSYASDGHGVALGFDAETIIMLKVPYYNHAEIGELVPYRATNTKEHIVWGALLAQVGYGDDARETAIGQELWQIEQHCGTNDVGEFGPRVYSCIHLIPLHLSNLAAVKHEGFKSEHEWRITIPEHFPSMSLSQISALSKLEGVLKLDYSGMPLTTVDVKFRGGGPAVFKPYTALPFPRSALVEVVLGPNVNAELAPPVIRRLLDRHGFRDTEIVPSSMPYRT